MVLKSSLGALALCALLALGVCGGVARALGTPAGFRDARLALLPALRDAQTLMSEADAGGGRGAAALLKAQDALWPAMGSALRPLFHGRVDTAGTPAAAARRLAAAADPPGAAGLAALRHMAERARNASAVAHQIRAARHAASGLAGQLSGPLGSLLSAIPAHGTAHAASDPAHRRLQEQQQLPHLLDGSRAASLEAKIHELGAARAALRARLGEALGRGAEAGDASAGVSRRRMHQAEPEAGFVGAGEAYASGEAEPSLPEGATGEVDEGEWAWWADELGGEEDEAWGAPLLDDYAAFEQEGFLGDPDVIIVKEVQLVPVASEMLIRMLYVMRDALDAAISLAAPGTDWATAYGSSGLLAPDYDAYYDDYAQYADLTEGEYDVAGEEEASYLASGGPDVEDALEEVEEVAEEVEGPLYSEAAPARRLRQVTTPPLPAGDPPVLRANEDAGDYFGEADDSDYSDGSDYSDYEEAYYDDLDDWLFDNPLELHVVLTRLTGSTGGSTGGSQKAPVGTQTGLPVFAVFAGSSHAAGVPTNATAEPAKPSGLQVLVAPFSEAARTPVPHTESQPGMQFDARYLGATISVACIALLLVGLLAVMRWSRARTSHPDQQESLLYAHIPGTPSRAGGSAAPTPTAWSAGKASSSMGGAVPKKLSNLPA